MEAPKNVFGSLMRSGFLCLCNGSIVVTIEFYRSDMLGTTPNSDMNFFIQTASFAASLAAIYPASVVELTIVSCFELFQLTAPPLRQNTKPDCDRESSLFYARNDQPDRMKCSSINVGPYFPATAEGQNTGRDINCIRIFLNIPKDLKPKCIKDYLECKISQRSLALLKKSAKAGPVVSSRDFPFVIQPKQIIEAPR
ncbi:hypothetical protein GQ457_08G026640 [Hibiscus cannabinus]